jgi:hypothetical protein
MEYDTLGADGLWDLRLDSCLLCSIIILGGLWEGRTIGSSALGGSAQTKTVLLHCSFRLGLQSLGMESSPAMEFSRLQGKCRSV